MTKAKSNPKTSKKPTANAAKPSKLDTLVALLRKPEGATVAELSSATKWQTHSVRGALAGALKKKGHVITSEVTDGVRRYRIAEAQA